MPFKEIGLLIVDEIGKNISGSGMDTNVIGRKFVGNPDEGRDDVCCKRIFIRGLTEETHGNACGIGLAEFTNRRTVDQMDQHITRINALTGGHPTAAAIPVDFRNRSRGSGSGPADGRAGRAGKRESRADLQHAAGGGRTGERGLSAGNRASASDLEIVDGPFEMEFDPDGFLLPVAAAGTAAMH